MEMVSQAQIKQFYVLLGKLKLKEQKESLLSGYNVSSSKNMTAANMKQLISRLLKMQETETTTGVRKQRSIMLALLTDMGIYNCTDKGSWSAVNALMLNPRISGKVMYEMDEAQLKSAILRVRAMKSKQTIGQPKGLL
jgi:hypothetical protein